MNTAWATKIIALLHDPPDKVLGLQHHEQRTMQFLNVLLGDARFREIFQNDAATLAGLSSNQFRRALDQINEWQLVKSADQIATAMDRAAFAREVRVEPTEYHAAPFVRHPLSGRLLFLNELRATDAHHIIPTAMQNAVNAAPPSPDEHTRYLWTWRNLHQTIANQLPDELKREWLLLPADTRICDHPLAQHLDATAAVASALPHPALLVFNLAGAQEFIATARRTQDLWMGSYILAYLAWRGMRVLAETYGPDAILYPALRGQPLVDHWLANDKQIPGITPGNLTMATLPNKFVALVPAGDAQAIGEQVQKEIVAAWTSLVDRVRDALAQLVGANVNQEWINLWDNHAAQFPQVYWSAHAWHDTVEKSKAQVRDLLDPPPGWAFNAILETYRATAPNMINLGTVYGHLHLLAQRGLDARKLRRAVAPIEEKGPKCTVCGIRAAIRSDALGEKEFWKTVADKLRALDDNQQHPLRSNYATIKPDGHERLCGVCATKRFAYSIIFRDQYDLQRTGFPSTSMVATASFRDQLFAQLDTNDTLDHALQNFVAALDGANIPRTAAPNAIPLNSKRARELGRSKAVAEKLIKYDGDWLFGESYTQKRVEEDYAIQLPDATINSLREKLNALLAAAAAADDARIARPAKYYAILALDGDAMGKWISGQLAPRFAQTLHPLAVERLAPFVKNDAAWAQWLTQQRVLSPALHTSISHALADFALECVRWVIEEIHPGRVVYAGGDDLLAFVPVDHALATARELRALFSGEALRADDKLTVTFADPDRTGFVRWKNSWLMTMGPTASASIGIAIAHHLQPLDAALDAARHALASAKEEYGRNAIAVRFLRRSGEELRIGAKFFYGRGDEPQQPPLDTLQWIDGLRARIADDHLSAKIAHDVYDLARGLTDQPVDAVEAILRRALKRHKGDQLEPEQAVKQANTLAPQLARLAVALDAPRQSWLFEQWRARAPDAANEPASGIVELAKWLLLARFLAQGGGEE
ncbi:MAG: type III-B CRISPR-associated protein Cas10/Cmr2 [Chloroflexi bacterium]|nr:type III-B CRISPR-associated protein Cas10/Cmr2 [Chloroflexota bacterium]